ncbi:MAG: TetR/AcrR family transcriptional regulator [Lentisphaeria bacterium]|nr:TetR/AcrR family transcriptional regulator [Lentisphaeria bacterium]
MPDRKSKREQIMKAAEAFFVARRYHEITMEEIAHRAGVGKGTLYRYFADKESLFHEVAASGYDTLCALVTSQGLGKADFREALVGTCEAIGGFLRHRRRLWHMMQMEERRLLCRHGRGRDAWLAQRGKLQEAVSGVLRRGVADGCLRRDIPAGSLATVLMGMLRGSAHEEDPESRLKGRQVAALFLHGASAAVGKDGL